MEIASAVQKGKPSDRLFREAPFRAGERLAVGGEELGILLPAHRGLLQHQVPKNEQIASASPTRRSLIRLCRTVGRLVAGLVCVEGS